MKPAEPCDDVVVLRKQAGAGWRVEFQHAENGGRIFAAVVSDREQAVKLAAEMCPGIPVRIVSSE